MSVYFYFPGSMSLLLVPIINIIITLIIMDISIIVRLLRVVVCWIVFNK